MAAEEVAVLEVRHMRAGYGDLDIVQDASVRVDAREVVALIGPNGAGKSTLLKAIMGLLPVRAGEVRFQGRVVTGTAPDVLVPMGVAYVPQVDNVFPRLTVRENLEMGAFLIEGPVEPLLERALGPFPALASLLPRRVSGLSGGERQMVAMGRALMSGPKVMLLDEPTAGLAPAVADHVFRCIRGLAEGGTPVLLVEQNARRALASADRGYVLENGQDRLEGTGLDLLQDPNVGRLYLGG